MEHYEYEISDSDHARPAALAEVTLNATPKELRRMSAFLSACANETERLGDAYGHVHLSDRMQEFDSSPHFVVMPLASS